MRFVVTGGHERGQGVAFRVAVDAPLRRRLQPTQTSHLYAGSDRWIAPLSAGGSGGTTFAVNAMRSAAAAAALSVDLCGDVVSEVVAESSSTVGLVVGPGTVGVGSASPWGEREGAEEPLVGAGLAGRPSLDPPAAGSAARGVVGIRSEAVGEVAAGAGLASMSGAGSVTTGFDSARILSQFEDDPRRSSPALTTTLSRRRSGRIDASIAIASIS